MIQDGYDINEAAAYCGFNSPWMVDYLCRAGVVIPTKRARPGRGRARLFSFSDLVVLRAINELLKRGISAKRLALKLRAHRARLREITGDALPFRYLVTDGIEIFLDTKEQGIERLEREGQYCFRFFIDLQQTYTELQIAVATAQEIRTMSSYRRTKRRS